MKASVHILESDQRIIEMMIFEFVKIKWLPFEI